MEVHTESNWLVVPGTPSTTPSEFSEVGGSLVSEENQLPFQMSLGEPGGSSKSQKKKDDHNQNNQNPIDPIPKTKNKKIHDTKVLPRTPSLITGPASSGSRPDRITMRVESGWCDPKFHGFSKTQNKGNTSAHTYSNISKSAKIKHMFSTFSAFRCSSNWSYPSLLFSFGRTYEPIIFPFFRDVETDTLHILGKMGDDELRNRRRFRRFLDPQLSTFSKVRCKASPSVVSMKIWVASARLTTGHHWIGAFLHFFYSFSHEGAQLYSLQP